jgi:hypothetical protein
MPLLEAKIALLENELNILKSSGTIDQSGRIVQLTLVNHFFNYVNFYLGVFHEPSFMASLTTQPMSLLYIMYALGLLYYQADTEASFDFTLLDRYCKLSHSDIKLDQTPSIDTCSTLLLIAYYAFCSCFFSKK